MIIYTVYAKHLDRDQFLGLATGDVKDIESYFDEKKGYGLYIKEAKITEVPAQYSKRKSELLLKKRTLEIQLQQLELEIRLVK